MSLPSPASNSDTAILPAGLQRLRQDFSAFTPAAPCPASGWTENAERSVDAQLAAAARQYLRARRRRDKLLPAQLFSDPAWDMLLDLFASDVEGLTVSVSDACVAACVPPTTALRWFGRLESLGLVERCRDPDDARRAHVILMPVARRAIWEWLLASRS